MGAFADSVKMNCDKRLQELSYKMNAITTELFTQIVYSTPVLNGYLRNSWFTASGGMFSAAESAVPDKTGSGSLLNIRSLTQLDLFYGRDNIVSMTNNLPYAYRIEYLGWSGYKAPYGMVRINLASVAAKYK